MTLSLTNRCNFRCEYCDIPLQDRAELSVDAWRAAIDELWAEDGVFYDPSKGAVRGRDAIDHIAGAVKATHPDFRYQVTAAPQEYCDAGMVPWISGRPGEVPAYSGRDFLIARDGRIVALYMFFDKLP